MPELIQCITPEFSHSEPARRIVGTGPSGVGKGTILDIVRNSEFGSQYKPSISMTTRAQRPGEVQGKSYDFVSPEAFEASIAAGKLLEWTQFNGNYYGTPNFAGQKVVYEVEVNGAKTIYERAKAEGTEDDLVLCYFLPSCTDALYRQLYGRDDNMGADQKASRLQTFVEEEAEIAKQVPFHYIVNRDPHVAAAQVMAAAQGLFFEHDDLAGTFESIVEGTRAHLLGPTVMYAAAG